MFFQDAACLHTFVVSLWCLTVVKMNINRTEMSSVKKFENSPIIVHGKKQTGLEQHEVNDVRIFIFG